MSRRRRQAGRPPQAPRWWSSLLATVRSALSWTRSLPSRMRERRLSRRRERLAAALLPLLVEQTEQLQDSLQPVLLQLDRKLTEQALLLQTQQEALRLTVELLQLVLTSLQPDPSEEISRLAGPPLLRNSPRSSVS